MLEGVEVRQELAQLIDALPMTFGGGIVAFARSAVLVLLMILHECLDLVFVEF